MNRLKDLKGKQGVVIDTMIFIYLFEDHPDYADICEQIIRWTCEGFFTGIITPITIAEILVKPLKQKRFLVADHYRSAFRSFPNISLSEINADIAFMAGSMKAKYAMLLPDMFQAAMALYFPAHALITNSRAMEKVKEIDIFLLDEIRKEP